MCCDREERLIWSEVLGQASQRRKLGSTDPTPGRKEVDQHLLASLLRERSRVSSEIPQCEIGRGLAPEMMPGLISRDANDQAHDECELPRPRSQAFPDGAYRCHLLRLARRVWSGGVFIGGRKERLTSDVNLGDLKG